MTGGFLSIHFGEGFSFLQSFFSFLSQYIVDFLNVSTNHEENND